MNTRYISIAAMIVSAGAAFSPLTPAYAGASGKSDLPEAGRAHWQGFYLGGQTGWSSSHGKDKTSGTKLKNSVFDAGVHAGYNWQSDGLVFGLEADANLFGLSEKNAHGPFSKSVLAPFSTTRLRVGTVFGDSLIYGTGGVSFGLGSHKLTAGGKRKSKLHTGWVIGAGVEHMITENWSLRGEYLYHNFGKKDYKFTGGKRNISFNDAHNVRIGVSYHF